MPPQGEFIKTPRVVKDSPVLLNAAVQVRVRVSRSIARQRCCALGAHKEGVHLGSISEPFQDWSFPPVNEIELLLGVHLDNQAPQMSEREQPTAAREITVASDIVRHAADGCQAIQKMNPRTVEQTVRLGVIVCSVRRRVVAHGLDLNCKRLQSRQCPWQDTSQRLICLLEARRPQVMLVNPRVLLVDSEDHLAERPSRSAEAGV